MKPAVFVMLVIAAGLLCACDPKAEGPPEGQRPSQPALEPTIKVNGSFEKLRGRWLRPDGGYIIEVKSVAADGNLEAAYYNPRPIHVAKAEASQAGDTVKVVIELRDVNYPGSTYTLSYDPANDRLAGDYFQAVIKQSFDVFFVRMTP